MIRETLEQANVIVGKSLDEAIKELEKRSIRWRVMEKDGVPLMGTDDIDPNRVNLVIEKGIVTEYYWG